MMGARRVLIVNPNTNVAITRWLCEEACRAARGRLEIVGVNAPSALPAIQTPSEVVVAARAVATAIADDTDSSGVIIAAFGDPGLALARASERRPIVGLGESGMLAAGAEGRRFAIVTLGEAMRNAIAERVETLGLVGLLADIRILPFSIAEVAAERDRLTHSIASEVAACAAACRAEAILLGGAPFAGMAAGLSADVDVPVLDGVEACVERLTGDLRRV